MVMVRLGSIQGTVPFSILAGILSTPYKEFNPCSSISAIVYQNHLFLVVHMFVMKRFKPDHIHELH